MQNFKKGDVYTYMEMEMSFNGRLILGRFEIPFILSMIRVDLRSSSIYKFMTDFFFFFEQNLRRMHRFGHLLSFNDTVIVL